MIEISQHIRATRTGQLCRGRVKDNCVVKTLGMGDYCSFAVATVGETSAHPQSPPATQREVPSAPRVAPEIELGESLKPLPLEAQEARSLARESSQGTNNYNSDNSTLCLHLPTLW